MDRRLKSMENENKVLRERFNGGNTKLSDERSTYEERIEQYLKDIDGLEKDKVDLEAANKKLNEDMIAEVATLKDEIKTKEKTAVSK